MSLPATSRWGRQAMLHLPEILDGDAPHTPKGCDAQAWGASEWVRVWRKLAEDAGDQ